MENNLALLHAFEVSVVHKQLKHKKGKCDGQDVHDLAQIFFPLLDILKPMVNNHTTDEMFKQWIFAIEEFGGDIEFDICPCSMHRPKGK
jgi:hypothetical protein